MNDETVALEVLVSFNGVTRGQTIHVPFPVDDYYQSLVDMGMLGGPGMESGQVLATDEHGDETTVLGVMSVANPARRRGRPPKMQPEPENPDGEADSEPA